MGQSAKTTVPSATPHVLIVDDDAAFADTLVSLLNGSGLDAKAVYSGREAIESALRSLPDFVLMDVIMEGIDGVDAAIAICEILPVPRVLLISGHPDAHQRLTKGSVRGHDFELLMKPVQFAWLLERFRIQDSKHHRGTTRAA